MKIPLPKIYSYEDIAEVKDDVLYIHKIGYFNDLMYNLTYAIKDYSKCYYCSNPLSRKNSTLDHMYPRDLGGPTIPNNLVISCTGCNSKKSNMTETEFVFYLSLPEDLQKEYSRDVLLQKYFQKKWYSPYLPDEWLTILPVDKITVYFFIGNGVGGKSYKMVEKTFKKSRHLYRPIIVDRNFKLLDGFNTLLFAKNNSISELSAIVLENVELKAECKY